MSQDPKIDPRRLNGLELREPQPEDPGHQVQQVQSKASTWTATMAEKKSVDQLKTERTTAKASFTRLVNSFTRNHEDMSEEELRDSFKRL